jgi:ribosomal protein S18 acetylase RimI-like enzyme
VATEADAVAVRSLDDAAFPPGDLDRQRAAPGELEAGIAAGDVYVLDLTGDTVAYVHIDRGRNDLVYVSGIAVRPDLQGRGLGSWMIDSFLESAGDGRNALPIITITSPHNHAMLRTLFRRGFAVRWFLPDYFGKDRHRFCCQLRSTGFWSPSRPSQWVTASPLEPVVRLLEPGTVVIRSLVRSRFEFIPQRADDFVSCNPPPRRLA